MILKLAEWNLIFLIIIPAYEPRPDFFYYIILFRKQKDSTA